MPTVHETCYPVLQSQSSLKELTALFSPTDDEISLAQEFTRHAATQLGFLVQFKTFQRLGYAINMADVPPQICHHIAGVCGLESYLPVLQGYDGSRTRKRHLAFLRELLQIHYFDQQASSIMASTMDEAAQSKHDVTDIINIAIEKLVEERYELPRFSRLVQAAQLARHHHIEALYHQVHQRLNGQKRSILNRLFKQHKRTQSTPWNRLKEEPGPPTLSRFQEWVERLSWLQTLQISPDALALIPAAKVAHFAAEAMTLDVLKMKELTPRKRFTLALCLLSVKLSQVLDDLAEFFIKRIRKIHTRGKTALDDYRKLTQEKTDGLITTLKQLILAFQSEGSAQKRLKAMGKVIGPDSNHLLRDCDSHLAFIGNNYLPFLTQPYKSSRPVLFRLLQVLPICCGTQDQSLIQAIEFIQQHKTHRGDWIPIDDSCSITNWNWMSRKWSKLVTGKKRVSKRPKKIHKTYFELCVFSYLSLGLQAGDLHIPGSDQFDDYYKQLISWEEYHENIEAFGQMLGMPVEGPDFIEHLKGKLRDECHRVDERYSKNPYLSYQNERWVLHKQKKTIPKDLKALEKAVAERMTPVSVLDVLTDTQRWLKWTDFFGPISGYEARVKEPTARYLLTTFCYGCNIGPSQLARAFQNLDRRQLSWIHHRHIQDHSLQKAIESIINFYNRFSLPNFWGTGKHASVDGTKWNIYEENLLAEYHIRYGGYGGIAYYHTSDRYIALFSHFIPCGVWEAIYILDGLFENKSDIQPDTIHGDTQAQSATVFALCYLLGIKLMPRIRGWQKLTFYKPAPNSRFKHLQPLFKQVAPWNLIETHLPDMWRVVLSIRAGKIQPSTLFRKLGLNSPNNKLFQAFKALGGVLRTIFLLQYLDDVDLRNMIQGCTNKSEAFNRLAKWLAFGGEQQVFTSNDREELRKRVKYNLLVANCLILHNVSEISQILNQLAREGKKFSAQAIAALSPYLTAHINRFGLYSVDEDREMGELDFDLDLSILLDEIDTGQELWGVFS